MWMIVLVVKWVPASLSEHPDRSSLNPSFHSASSQAASLPAGSCPWACRREAAFSPCLMHVTFLCLSSVTPSSTYLSLSSLPHPLTSLSLRSLPPPRKSLPSSCSTSGTTASPPSPPAGSSCWPATTQIPHRQLPASFPRTRGRLASSCRQGRRWSLCNS